MKKQLIFLLPLICLASACAHRHTPSNYVVIDGFAQGSTYHFVIEMEDTTGLQRQIDSLLLAVDESMSVYYPNSLINRINDNQTDVLDEHIIYCIEESEKISILSDGMFDITIKPITEAWGFAGEGKTEDPNIDSLLTYVGYDKIEIRDGRLVKRYPQMKIDLNTVAQGYTADLLGRLMESRGSRNYLVEIGGEIFCKGISPRGADWVVGIDKPFEGNNIPGNDLQVKLSMSNEGLATSGNYRKYYTDSQGRKITHILNARTGYSEISNLLSATVIAENATIADVYGTLFMILGLERSIELLEEREDILGYLVYTDDKGNYQVYASQKLLERIIK